MIYLILKKIIQPCKLLLSCGELEPKFLKINQFLVGEISKLLIALNVETPCISSEETDAIFTIPWGHSKTTWTMGGG